MTILAHPAWPGLRGFLRAEAYDRDTNQNGDIRYRIEVLMPDDAVTRAWLCALRTPCVRCGRMMSPVRARASWVSCYLAVACPLSVDVACSRGAEAAQAYRDIVQDLRREARWDPQQALFV